MEDRTPSPSPSSSPTFGNIGLYATFAMFFLVPVFFVPLQFAPLQLSKTLLVLALLVLGIFAFLFSSLKKGTLRISWSLLHIAIWLLPLTYFISALFSSQPYISFLGYRLDTDTFGFVLLAAVLTHIVGFVFVKKSHIFSALIVLLFGAWVVMAFQFVQVVFGAPFPLFSDPTNNLIGRWNDLGVFIGLVASLLVLALESLPLPKRHHLILTGTFLLTLLFMVLANMFEVWVLFASVSFVALVIGVSRKFLSEKSPAKDIATGVFSGLGFIVALFFIFSGGNFATIAQQTLSINAFEVRPSFQATTGVLSAAYNEDPIFSSGPNTFGNLWLLHRSSEIVQTPFWNVSFNAGSGTLFSSAAAGGLVVALAWLLFVVALVYTVFRVLVSNSTQEQRSYFVVSMSAVGALYLLLIHLLYAPTQSITLLLFLFVGLFLASISDTKFVREIEIPLRKSHRAGFAFVLGGIVIFLFALSSVYVVGSKYVSIFYHNRAITTANSGDFEGGFVALNRAAQLDAQDRYYRTAALISIAEMNRIVNSGDSTEASQEAFQNALASAVQSANVAVERNSSSFQNMMVRGLVFESVVPLQIEGAFENAVAVYDAARTLNPLDPEIDYRLAQMYVARGDVVAAREALAEALSRKADYTDAILLLAQIELDAGNLSEAIDTVRGAVFFEPQNPVLLYQLGILLLQDENYEEASLAFEAALSLDPVFANAAFFLAQAYAFTDKLEEATQLMEQLIERSPENRELLEEYRDALNEGVNPFSNAPVAPDEELEEVVE